MGLAAGGLLFGALAGYLGSSGSVTRVFALCAVFLPVVLWKRPYLAPAILLAAAVMFEQTIQIPHIPITESIPMFQSVGPGHLEGADLLLIIAFFIYLVKGKEWGPRWFPRTHVSVAMRALLACVVLAIAVGEAHGGSLRMSMMEARPYVYLAVTYFLTSVMVRDRRAIRALLWAFVGAVAFKALQGTYVWIGNRHLVPKPESYIGHEASYFFVSYFFLVLAMWLFDQRGKLRTWATWLLPLVLWANIVNDRRVAWEMLGGGLLCFGVISTRPCRSGGTCWQSRSSAWRSYPPSTSRSCGTAPAAWASRRGRSNRRSSPSARDDDSDLYRVQENANLEYNIKQNGLLGMGFGTKIDYALPIADISHIDELIAYIPHDDVLDVLMRMGLLGGMAMWSLIGTGIISGSRLARSRDREVAMIGAVVACSLVAYALMGAEDQAFFFYRIAFITGVFLGLAEAARRMARADSSLSPPTLIATNRQGVHSIERPPVHPIERPLVHPTERPSAPPESATLQDDSAESGSTATVGDLQP